jgi:hypothetical protein
MFNGLRIPPVWSRIDRTGWAGQTSDEQRPRERSLSQSDGYETGCQNGRPGDPNGEPEVPIGGRSPGRIGQGTRAQFLEPRGRAFAIFAWPANGPPKVVARAAGHGRDERTVRRNRGEKRQRPRYSGGECEPAKSPGKTSPQPNITNIIGRWGGPKKGPLESPFTGFGGPARPLANA